MCSKKCLQRRERECPRSSHAERRGHPRSAPGDNRRHATERPRPAAAAPRPNGSSMPCPPEQPLHLPAPAARLQQAVALGRHPDVKHQPALATTTSAWSDDIWVVDSTPAKCAAPTRRSRAPTWQTRPNTATAPAKDASPRACAYTWPAPFRACPSPNPPDTFAAQPTKQPSPPEHPRRPADRTVLATRIPLPPSRPSNPATQTPAPPNRPSSPRHPVRPIRRLFWTGRPADSAATRSAR
ncbi:hypothetical protein B0I32_10578 [Nonomuraea fuscirosea]|uniref:Uncharacterized protein n=1 Tax=Nonomuraea fuscirosea TaxID=1291556 RepID=A0A2T0N3C3_9ACTN|nr:hypothetical protein B0I32_10578 [Nonomuraea fuscirosea]